MARGLISGFLCAPPRKMPTLRGPCVRFFPSPTFSWPSAPALSLSFLPTTSSRASNFLLQPSPCPTFSSSFSFPTQPRHPTTPPAPCPFCSSPLPTNPAPRGPGPALPGPVPAPRALPPAPGPVLASARLLLGVHPGALAASSARWAPHPGLGCWVLGVRASFWAGIAPLSLEARSRRCPGWGHLCPGCPRPGGR